MNITPYQVLSNWVSGQHPWLMDLETKLRRGQACMATLQEMHSNGFHPDVVLAHPGWGESLFVRDVWPRTQLVLYGEFFYRALGQDVNFDPEFAEADVAQMGKLRLRNANHLLHLDAADAVISPTQWQAATFPEAYRHKISVIHDGVDFAALRAVHPEPLVIQGKGRDGQAQTSRIAPGDELITFVSRNLEPYRGYHIFMRALPNLLRHRPNARVLIIGGDEVSYGPPPKHGSSWKQIFIDEVRPLMNDSDWRRVHFLGRLPYQQYLAVLRLSMVHVYLTYPFVLSWSLMEAMGLGCAIVASDTGPVREVIAQNETGRLVPFFDIDALVNEIDHLLDDPQTRQRLGQAASRLAKQRYDLHSVCLPAQQRMLAGIIPPWTNSKPSSPSSPSPSREA